MTSSASILLTPGEDASWRVWKPRSSSPSEAVGSPAEASDRSRSVLVGLPATACRTVALVLPQAAPALLDEMVASQLERRGMKGAHGERAVFRSHVVGHAGPNVLVSVDVLAEPFPDELAVENAENYAAALRLVQLPAGQLLVAEEQGELVIAANHQGKLLHSHVFAQRPADADSLAQEVQMTRLGLDAIPGFGGIQGITLSGQWDADVVNDLRHLAGMPVQQVDRLAPSASLDTRSWSLLLPRSVSERRAAAASRRKVIMICLGIAVIAALAIAAGFWHLQQRTAYADELAQKVEAIAAPAASVKETSQRWKAMSAALDTNTYPMVLLAEVTKIMPPSGINLRDFTVRKEEIQIRCDARDLPNANSFLEDLKKNKALSRYNWTMPPPSQRESKGALSCRIQGKLSNQ